ncbi:rhoA GTPase effector DIA/Diaphanous [Rhodotorula toruloides]|uniref:RhoA GTPase effector DIA/Diaphanous n=1 Tax=Rhodotorula toruloides TaxID=5286 RepID=A0A511KHU8_RHOTO|nr:rhoA GTPase effector DIA/Diaphanous [Rhodotorula toruloides]
MPRKEFNKDSRGGWEDEHVEREPHPEDRGRCDPSLPWDPRLLACCDEFRSLRLLGQLPYEVNYQNVLRYFQVDIVALREKYSLQSLRGYDPDDFDDDAGDEDGDDEDDGGEAKEATVELSVFFNNRTNDRFLKFMLVRNVFPGHKRAIDACIGMCDVARAQLVNTSTLGSAVRVLFPDADSVLPSPIIDRPDPAKQLLADPLPDVSSAVSIVDDAEEDDELRAEVASPEEMPAGDQAKQAKQEKEEKEPDEPEEKTRRRIAELEARFERGAMAMEACQKSGRKAETSTSVLKDALAKVYEGDEEVEGEWRVAVRERGARSLVGWEMIYEGRVAPVAAGGDAGEQRPLEAEEHMLVKHLDALNSSILEAYLSQLVFIPIPPNDTVETLATPLWIVDRRYRVIPSYWQHAGELLREEPGRTMSHPGGYGPLPQETLAKIEEEMAAEEAEKARAGDAGDGGPAQMEDREVERK